MKARQVNLVVPATQTQVAQAKARLNETADKVPAFRAVFPGFQEAIDALPDLSPLVLICQEMRPAFFDALSWAGAHPPRELWDYLGIGWLYREPEKVSQ